jgi:glucan 1,3-beta-glucosidase
MGFIQTETPYVAGGNCHGGYKLIRVCLRYYQPTPFAPTPFSVVPTLNDPNFASSCAGTSGNCADAWGLRILNSHDVFIYGAGLYSFFNDYDTSKLQSSNPLSFYYLPRLRQVLAACSNGGGPENCQSNIFSLEGSISNVNVYCLSTVGTTNMVIQNGKTLASYSDNVNVYPDTIALFTTGAVVLPTGPSLLGWNYRGCYTDAYPGRTLGNLVQVQGGAAAMSIEACIIACTSARYSLAGVEYSGECCKFCLPPFYWNSIFNLSHRV